MSGCATVNQVSDSAVCQGLMIPMDDFAQALLDNIEETPMDVTSTGAKVISGFDAGCSR